MLEAVTAFAISHPLLNMMLVAAWSGALATLRQDRESWSAINSWRDFGAFDWGLASFRMCKGIAVSIFGLLPIAGVTAGLTALSFYALRLLLPALLVVGLVASSSACDKARHIAVTVDATVAQAVFAVDDAEWNAWKSGAISDERHVALNPKIKAALESVKTATAAVRAMKADGQVPGSLVTLIEEMRAVQTIVLGLPPSDLTRALGGKVDTALDKVIGLLSQVVGTEGQ